MSDQELVAEFNELLQNFERGLYTRAEIIGQSIDLLGEGNAALWERLPEWVRSQIEMAVLSFSEDEEVFSFSRRNRDVVKRELLALKRWLIERKASPGAR